MIQSKAEKALLERIKDARADRSRIGGRINEFYALAIPHRPRVGERVKRQGPDLSQQDDIFDQTLQQAVSDFAADQIDFFTPDYKPWVKMKAGLDVRGNRELGDRLREYEERLYDLIRETDFYEQQQEVFHDLAGGAGGISIPNAPISRPVRCQPILMASLLFDEGPLNDLDGRWQEYFIKRRHLEQVFPDIQFPNDITRLPENGDIGIVQGIYRQWGAPTEAPVWVWCVIANEKVVHNKPLPANAPPSVLVARWRTAPPSPWGPGPADLAMAPGRSLDELSYRNLKKLAKEVDTPYSYEADGVMNPDNGIEPGTWIARRAGSKEPTPLFEPSNSQNVYFDREVMQYTVKRALYQDGPFQRGDTPPTATQWLDEKASNQRRQIARRRIYREYVLPALQRFAWVFAARGELEPVAINGREVAVEFVSPLSRASDAEEVSAGIQLAQSIVGVLGETGLATIDPFETASNWKTKLGDNTVALKAPDDQANLVRQILTEGRNLVSSNAA